MSVRYTDMGLDAVGARDFVARNREPTLFQVGMLVLSGFLIAVSLSFSIPNRGVLLFTLLCLFGILGVYILLHLMRARDMMLVTEFQNALFASALGLHNKFCIIIKRDGAIVYLDRAFQNLFPELIKHPGRSVEMLLKHGKVTKESTNQVLSIIEQGVYEKAVFDITDTHGITHHIILSVEPILRPAGFTMLRGRTFVDDRRTIASAPAASAEASLFHPSSFPLFSHVMERMHMGIYICSPKGSLVYCNPLLEAWLGYDHGELTQRNTTLRQLLPELRNPKLAAEASDFEGEVHMERKVGGFISMFLNQRVILNDQGQPMGCTAVVHLLQTTPPPKADEGSF